MLRELRNVQQIKGEPQRRWFFCNDIDLVTWEADDGSICAFQLAYDKHRNEHSISWSQERGFTHYVVDDGEPMAGVNDTPILYADGPFKRDRAIDAFLAMSAEVPENIVDFVTTKLREFDGPVLP